MKVKKSVKIDQSANERLSDIAQSQQTTASHVLRLALDHYIKQYPGKLT